MDNLLFRAEITDGKGNYAELNLPASDYELLDAVERLGAEPVGHPDCTVIEYLDYAFLAPLLDESKPLYEFNGLARKLAELDLIDSVSFEGLVKMEIEKKEGAITLPKLIDLAYSADCCNAEPAFNDEELGKFYAENDFMPELEDMYTLNGIKSRTVGDGQHGTARWATKKEIQQTFAHVPFKVKDWRHGKDRPKEQGLVLGSIGKKNAVTALVDHDDIHCLMIGASGVGKTAFFLYPNLEYACASGMSFLALDTKGDLARNYGTIAKKYYCNICYT